MAIDPKIQKEHYVNSGMSKSSDREGSDSLEKQRQRITEISPKYQEQLDSYERDNINYLKVAKTPAKSIVLGRKERAQMQNLLEQSIYTAKKRNKSQQSDKDYKDIAKKIAFENSSANSGDKSMRSSDSRTPMYDDDLIGYQVINQFKIDDKLTDFYGIVYNKEKDEKGELIYHVKYTDGEGEGYFKRDIQDIIIKGEEKIRLKKKDFYKDKPQEIITEVVIRYCKKYKTKTKK